MRVLHVVASDQRRGGERFASDLTRALEAFGVSQRVAVLRGGSTADTSFRVPTTFLGRGRHLLPALRVEPGAVRRLRSLAEAWRPHVVQAHGGEPLKYAVFARIHRGADLVYRRLGPAASGLSGPRRWAHARLARRARSVVVVAETLRDELVHGLGVRPDRIVSIPNGVDPARVEPRAAREETRRELRIGPSTSVVLAVGALAPEKDPWAYLEVAHRLAAARSNVVLLLVGDGPLRPQLAARVHARGLDASVRLLGGRDDMGSLLGASDVVLLASRMEGMPASLIEAGMAGVPSVAYSVGGTADVVRDGVTGFLARPGRLDELTRLTSRLLDRPDMRTRMGQAATRWCRDRFDVRRVAYRYLELYRGLLDAATPAAASASETPADTRPSLMTEGPEG
jgi:glycosyltransferase involved in cell wall biosynthesis